MQEEWVGFLFMTTGMRRVFLRRSLRRRVGGSLEEEGEEEEEEEEGEGRSLVKVSIILSSRGKVVVCSNSSSRVGLIRSVLLQACRGWVVGVEGEGTSSSSFRAAAAAAAAVVEVCLSPRAAMAGG